MGLFMTETNEIIRVAARGDGVTADGQYIAHAAPGDILDPAGGLIHGPHHATPPCQHFPYIDNICRVYTENKLSMEKLTEADYILTSPNLN